MSNIDVKPFKSTILQEFTNIIMSEFRSKTRLVNFLESIEECEDAYLPGWNRREVLCTKLSELQNKFGTGPILKLITDVCDPQEYINKPDKHQKIVQKFNTYLKFSSIKIDKENKLVPISKTTSKTSFKTANSNLFKARSFHPKVVRHAKQQFTDGHYFDAVDECCKAFEKHVAEKSKTTKRGCKLMSEFLNNNSGSLKLNSGETQTEQDSQEGLMHLCMGLVLGIRNPVEHEPQLDYSIRKQDALDVLSFISYLYRQIDKCSFYS